MGSVIGGSPGGGNGGGHGGGVCKVLAPHFPQKLDMATIGSPHTVQKLLGETVT